MTLLLQCFVDKLFLSRRPAFALAFGNIVLLSITFQRSYELKQVSGLYLSILCLSLVDLWYW